jgi:CheY-like chemotaxis protein
MERQMLERLGYRVNAHTKSPSALDVFVANPQTFDLVITDMTMPAMTGDQLAMNIRKAHRTIPIILCTGYNEKISSETAREIGISQFLTKPLTLEELARAIRQLLDRRTRNGRND